MMRINSNRHFRHFGKRFFVQDIPSGYKEREGGYKYSLYMLKDGWWRLVGDKTTFRIPHFKTIKDAQRWVMWCSGDGEFIDID
jgi:hypothetical protein